MTRQQILHHNRVIPLATMETAQMELIFLTSSNRWDGDLEGETARFSPLEWMVIIFSSVSPNTDMSWASFKMFNLAPAREN